MWLQSLRERNISPENWPDDMADGERKCVEAMFTEADASLTSWREAQQMFEERQPRAAKRVTYGAFRTFRKYTRRALEPNWPNISEYAVAVVAYCTLLEWMKARQREDRHARAAGQ